MIQIESEVAGKHTSFPFSLSGIVKHDVWYFIELLAFCHNAAAPKHILELILKEFLFCEVKKSTSGLSSLFCAITYLTPSIITICLKIRPDNLLVSQRLFLERTTESHQVFVKMDCIHQSMFQSQLKPDHRHKYPMLHMHCVSVSEFGKFQTGHGKNF